jgi:hypothetical protein
MYALLFIVLGILFFTMVLNAVSSRELKARGWGFSIRIYQRDSEPIMYWINFVTYLIIAIWATVFGVLLAYKSFF